MSSSLRAETSARKRPPEIQVPRSNLFQCMYMQKPILSHLDKAESRSHSNVWSVFRHIHTIWIRNKASLESNNNLANNKYHRIPMDWNTVPTREKKKFKTRVLTPMLRQWQGGRMLRRIRRQDDHEQDKSDPLLCIQTGKKLRQGLLYSN